MISAVILAAFLIGSSDRYQVIGESEKYKILVERDTIAEVGQLREARMVYQLKVPAANLVPGKRDKITYVIKNSIYDCNRNKLKILSQGFFDKDLVPKALTEKPTDWIPVDKESNGEVEQKFVCKYNIPKIKVKDQTLVRL